MSDFSYESLKDLHEFKHLPLLTLDERWYRLMPDAIKTDEIRYWEKKVNELLKKRGQVTNDIQDIQKLKKQLIQSVVLHMEDDDTDPKHNKLMQENQRLIQEAKEKIANLEDESKGIPSQLKKANQRLMIETVKVCYGKINENAKDIDVLDQWINATRIKLKKNLLIKQDKEVVNEEMYSYMHDILGSEVMSELDRINDSDQ